MNFTFDEVEDVTAASSVWTVVGIAAGVGLAALACD